VAEVRTTSSTGGQKGTKLARFDLIPVGPLTELAEHFGIGASKYANHQWRQGYEWSKTYAALMRHLTAWWNGFDFDVCSNDPEGCSHVDTDGNAFVAVREDACFNHTGSHHLAAVAWHAFAGLEFKDRFPEHDDRYKAPDSNALEEDCYTDIGYTTEEAIRDYESPKQRWLDDMLSVAMIPRADVIWGTPEPITIRGLEDHLTKVRDADLLDDVPVTPLRVLLKQVDDRVSIPLRDAEAEAAGFKHDDSWRDRQQGSTRWRG
jgi:hypothetical protein